MVLDLIYQYFFSGTVAEGGSWGGEACAAVVSRNTHVLETIFWLIACTIFWKEFSLRSEYDKLLLHAQKYDLHSSPKRLFRIFELLLGCVEGLIFLFVVYYKINKMSLCYLFQPCHIVLLIQSYALLADNARSNVYCVLSLSMVTGTVLAILVPDTSGLDQPYEAEMYWIQHYIIQLVPILLLLRNDGLVLKMTTFKSIILANWFVVVLHWAFFEVILAPVGCSYTTSHNAMYVRLGYGCTVLGECNVPTLPDEFYGGRHVRFPVVALLPLLQIHLNSGPFPRIYSLRLLLYYS